MSESESSTSPSPGDISASSPPSSPLYNGEYIYNFGHDENDENIESSESSISFYHIPIGTNHQALLPSFHDRNKDKEEISQGELVWDASKISEEKGKNGTSHDLCFQQSEKFFLNYYFYNSGEIVD